MSKKRHRHNFKPTTCYGVNLMQCGCGMYKMRPLSKCCGMLTKSIGLPDFPGDTYPVTMHYECLGCGKACDLREEPRDE